MNKLSFSPDKDTIARLALEACAPTSQSSGEVARFFLEAWSDERVLRGLSGAGLEHRNKNNGTRVVKER